MCGRHVTTGVVVIYLHERELFRGCHACWGRYLETNPIAKVLWNTLVRIQGVPGPVPVVKTCEQLLEESGGEITAEIATRIVEFSRATNQPRATVRDVIASERRAMISVVTTPAEDRSSLEVVKPPDDGPDEAS